MSIQQNPKAFRFQYTARDQSGARKTGHLEASDSQAVTMKLRAQGLFPVEVTRADAPVKAKKATLKRTKTTDVASGNLSRKQTADLVSRLAKLTGRRVPVERALAVVADGEDAKIASTAAAIRKSIREGAPLSTALQNEAGISDTATLSLIRGAEVSGELAEALDTAANLLNQRIQLIRRIGTGLMYPCLLLVVAAISLGLILIAIIPQFRPLVEDRMDQVPAMGRAIFFVSEIMVALWPLILGTILIAAAAILIMRRMGKGGAFMSSVIRRLPFVGSVIGRNQTMMVLQTLSALLARGVILSQALKVTVNAVSDEGPTRDALQESWKRVEGGETLAGAFKATNLLPGSTLEVIRIGEESGDLAEMIGKAADDMRENADRELERFLALFQPALIIIVGLMIGVSLYALFSAIVSVNAISI